MIGRFVRQLGITDTRISPSHSWRHRIKTMGRRYDLAKDILEAIEKLSREVQSLRMELASREVEGTA